MPEYTVRLEGPILVWQTRLVEVEASSIPEALQLALDGEGDELQNKLGETIDSSLHFAELDDDPSNYPPLHAPNSRQFVPLLQSEALLISHTLSSYNQRIPSGAMHSAIESLAKSLERYS